MAHVSSVAARPRHGAPQFVLVPKPGGGVRRLTLLPPAGDLVYRRVVGRLTEMIERVLGPEVAANRTQPRGQLRLRPWRSERGAFERSRGSLIAGAAVAVKADVRECYPSITPSAVERALVRAGAWASDTLEIRRTLERLGELGVAGLPIGPDPSAVLANVVLTAADDAARDALARHVRWVDDLWVAARSERHSDEILDRLRGALGRTGLELNEGKTRVFDRAEALALAAAAEDGYR